MITYLHDEESQRVLCILAVELVDTRTPYGIHCSLVVVLGLDFQMYIMFRRRISKNEVLCRTKYPQLQYTREHKDIR